jgi:hypothetical protein
MHSTTQKTGFVHSATKEEFPLIINNAEIDLGGLPVYKMHWQIELHFRRILQAYPLRYSRLVNENEIKLRIWCAIIADLLVKIIKDRIRRKLSYAHIRSMI